jgi:hypothetical protein
MATVPTKTPTFQMPAATTRKLGYRSGTEQRRHMSHNMTPMPAMEAHP